MRLPQFPTEFHVPKWMDTLWRYLSKASPDMFMRLIITILEKL